MTYYKESGEKISICSECGAQRICKIGALWILNFTVRASYQIINRTTNSVFCFAPELDFFSSGNDVSYKYQREI